MMAIPAFLLLVSVATGCLFAAARWPRGGQIAALVITGVMALGPAGLAVSAVAYATDPAQAGSFGADVAATFGIVMAGAGALLVALAVAILRGSDATRRLIGAVLGVLGGLAAWWIISELAQGGNDVNAASALLSAVGLAGMAAAALLMGASGAMSRLRS